MPSFLWLGVLASLLHVAAGQCSGTASVLYGNIGTLEYPGGGTYSNNLNCRWILRASLPLQITVTYLSIEANFDDLTLYNGEAEGADMHLATLDENDRVPFVIDTRGSALVILRTDGSVTRYGFRLSYAPASREPCMPAALPLPDGWVAYSDANNPDSVASFSCDSGFYRVGSSSVTCYNASWPAHSVSCEDCACNSSQSVSAECNSVGHCDCLPGYFGNKCDGVCDCPNGTYADSGCAPGGVGCDACPDGYVCEGGPAQPVDINECDGDWPCSNLTVCENTNGSFTCTCDPGFFPAGGIGILPFTSLSTTTGTTIYPDGCNPSGGADDVREIVLTQTSTTAFSASVTYHTVVSGYTSTSGICLWLQWISYDDPTWRTIDTICYPGPAYSGTWSSSVETDLSGATGTIVVRASLIDRASSSDTWDGVSNCATGSAGTSGGSSRHNANMDISFDLSPTDSSTAHCEPCDCTPSSSVGSECSVTGQCTCIDGAFDRKCDKYPLCPETSSAFTVNCSCDALGYAGTVDWLGTEWEDNCYRVPCPMGSTGVSLDCACDVPGFTGSPAWNGTVWGPCEDVNECLDVEACGGLDDVVCTNTYGSFLCACPEGSYNRVGLTSELVRERPFMDPIESCYSECAQDYVSVISVSPGLTGWSIDVEYGVTMSGYTADSGVCLRAALHDGAAWSQLDHICVASGDLSSSPGANRATFGPFPNPTESLAVYTLRISMIDRASSGDTILSASDAPCVDGTSGTSGSTARHFCNADITLPPLMAGGDCLPCACNKEHSDGGCLANGQCLCHVGYGRDCSEIVPCPSGSVGTSPDCDCSARGFDGFTEPEWGLYQWEHTCGLAECPDGFVGIAPNCRCPSGPTIWLETEWGECTSSVFGCDSVITSADGNGGIVRHPLSMISYSNGERCMWQFDMGAPLTLTPVRFRTESCCDILVVTIDGESVSYSGGFEAVEGGLYSPSGRMHLSWTSDSSVTAEGFEFSFYAGHGEGLDDCPSTGDCAICQAAGCTLCNVDGIPSCMLSSTCETYSGVSRCSPTVTTTGDDGEEDVRAAGASAEIEEEEDEGLSTVGTVVGATVGALCLVGIIVAVVFAIVVSSRQRARNEARRTNSVRLDRPPIRSVPPAEVADSSSSASDSTADTSFVPPPDYTAAAGGVGVDTSDGADESSSALPTYNDYIEGKVATARPVPCPSCGTLGGVRFCGKCGARMPRANVFL